eukprot:TRINITY_DN4590_c0_g1_i2.p1 TRINITY_DN4590_c0_g1~~TRINITY_DN4590_c0_g1_i2.p1  ORF type:complete len:191 (+),score=23.59 TRINITY_DN4590_c0_g1_i2:87-659(+)
MAADEQRARTGAASPKRSTCSRKDTSKRYARGDAHLFEFVAEGGHLIHSGATSCAASVKETMSSTSDFLCALAGQILGFDDSQGQVTLCAGPRRRVPERAPAALETPKVVRGSTAACSNGVSDAVASLVCGFSVVRLSQQIDDKMRQGLSDRQGSERRPTLFRQPLTLRRFVLFLVACGGWRYFSIDATA